MNHTCKYFASPVSIMFGFLVAGLCISAPLAASAQTGTIRLYMLRQQLAVLQQQLAELQKLELEAPALKITTDYSQIEDTVTAGNVWLPFAKYVFDTHGSGESVSISALSAVLASTATTSLAKCRISDGTIYLTPQTHAVNPEADIASYRFVFFSPIVILPNILRTLLLSCDVAEAAVSADLFRWGLDASKFDTVKGMLSGKEFVPTIISNRGAIIVVAQ